MTQPINAPLARETPIEFLKLSDVAKKVSLSRATIKPMVRDGRFPKPVRLSESRNAFVREEVETWQRERLAERDAGAQRHRGQPVGPAEARPARA